MQYHPGNVEPCTTVYDVDTKARIDSVVSIDTEAGEVRCHYQPIRIDVVKQEAETFAIRYRSIHAISGAGQARRPCLFHCYGRLGDSARAPLPAGLRA